VEEVGGQDMLQGNYFQVHSFITSIAAQAVRSSCRGVIET
jgi:hypothetical protein